MVSNSIICATPRSGSNFLCELLSYHGSVGRAGEHLWDPPNTEDTPLTERWPIVLRTGADESGVFSLKLMWYQAARLEAELPGMLEMPGEALSRVWDAQLGDTKYVYLTRRNHLRQAISLARAEQTEQWRSMDNAVRKPHYDREAIQRNIRFLEADEANWEAFFRRNAVIPYRLLYEDLDANPENTIKRLMTHLGADAKDVSVHKSQHQRQADIVTEAWVRRYSEEDATTRGT